MPAEVLQGDYMDNEKIFQELNRAEDHFRETVQLHIAAMRSIILAATIPGADALLQGQIKINDRLKRGVGIDAIKHAEDVLFAARREFDDDFVRLRHATLVSMCSAFEYLAKAAYVDQASSNPTEAGRRLDGVNVRLRASEVIGSDSTERWYLIADRLLDYLGEQASNKTRGFGDRARRLLIEYVPSDEARTAGVKAAFSGHQLVKLNEAFLVRNCLVHNGGRVNAALSSVSGKARAELLVLDRSYGPELMQALIEVQEALSRLRL
jgi:hypothetical protein